MSEQQDTLHDRISRLIQCERNYSPSFDPHAAGPPDWSYVLQDVRNLEAAFKNRESYMRELEASRNVMAEELKEGRRRNSFLSQSLSEAGMRHTAAIESGAIKPDAKQKEMDQTTIDSLVVKTLVRQLAMVYVNVAIDSGVDPLAIVNAVSDSLDDVVNG